METTQTIIDDISVKGTYKAVHVKKIIIKLVDNIEQSRTNFRYVLMPNRDVSSEDSQIQQVCNENWTQEIKDSYSNFLANDDI
jgi:hypothetical protein